VTWLSVTLIYWQAKPSFGWVSCSSDPKLGKSHGGEVRECVPMYRGSNKGNYANARTSDQSYAQPCKCFLHGLPAMGLGGGCGSSSHIDPSSVQLMARGGGSDLARRGWCGTGVQDRVAWQA
jgi:hypothetical protein